MVVDLCIGVSSTEEWKDLDGLKETLTSHYFALKNAIGEVMRCLNHQNAVVKTELPSVRTVGEGEALELCTTTFDRWMQEIDDSKSVDANELVGKLFILRERCAATIGFLADARDQLTLAVRAAGASAPHCTPCVTIVGSIWSVMSSSSIIATLPLQSVSTCFTAKTLHFPCVLHCLRAGAGSLVRHGLIPAKLNPIIKALVAGVRAEPRFYCPLPRVPNRENQHRSTV